MQNTIFPTAAYMADMEHNTDLTTLTDLELTTLATTATGRARERAWVEVVSRVSGVAFSFAKNAFDAEERVSAVFEMLAIELTEPVEELSKWAYRTFRQKNYFRQELVRDARAGLAGVTVREVLTTVQERRDGDAETAVAVALAPTSLDALMEATDGGFDFANGNSEARVFTEEEQRVLDAVSTLDATAQAVCTATFGLDGAGERNAAEVAAELNITEQEVRNALQRMRRTLRAAAEAPAPAVPDTEALENLAPLDRAVYRARFGLAGAAPVRKAADIAEIVGLTPREVTTALQRAKRELARAA